MDQALASPHPRFSAKPSEARVELQGREAQHLGLRDSVPSFRCPSQATHDCTLPDSDDDYTGSHYRLGTALYDPPRVCAFAEPSRPKAPARGADQGVQG